MQISITIVIIIVTVAISLLGFQNEQFMRKWIFNPYIIKRRKEVWRFLTAAFLHANYLHLALNMFVLWSFGTKSIEHSFESTYKGNQVEIVLYYLLLYIPAAVLSCFYSYEKHKNNIHYNALGASGAVSAVVFASIGLRPTSELGLFGVIPIKSFIFGILFLVVSWVLARRGKDNIGHDAHFFGALYGIMYIFIIQPWQLHNFVTDIQLYIQNLF